MEAEERGDLSNVGLRVDVEEGAERVFIVGETGDETLEDRSRVLRKEGGAGEEESGE